MVAAPVDATTFTALGLSDRFARPLAALGFTEPTAIQRRSIPVVLEGRDLLARSQTGTGKTAAFGLPMIEQLLVKRRHAPVPRAPRGLVLAPTRELAVQIEQALRSYGAPLGLRTAVILGGLSMGPQIAALRRGTDIVVATPGRLLDHLERRTIDLARVEMLVLDEADRMLDMGFLPSLKRIREALPRTRQTLLFSATLPVEVRRLSTEFAREPIDLDVSQADAVPSTVVHRVRAVGEAGKSGALRDVLTGSGQALVFCRTKRRSDRVGEHLNRSGITAAVIHGNKSQGARNRALGDFKAGRVSVLVATDIAARGLDIAQLPLVVNYDLPMVAEDYVHRIGRTGRAGRAGCAISLVSDDERGKLHAIRRLVQTPLEEVREAGVSRAPAPEPPPPSHRRARRRPRPFGRRHRHI